MHMDKLTALSLSFLSKFGLAISDPRWLWLLAAVPLVVGLSMVLALMRRRKLKESYGDGELIARFTVGISPLRISLKGLAVGLALASLILAVTRPTSEAGANHYPAGSIDVVAVVDVSRSMAVPDYKDSHLPAPFADGRRLDMAKYLLSTEVMGSLNYNRLGVVTFAGEPYPQAFITDDLQALRWFMKTAIQPGSAPGDGSQLAAAFKMAFTLFDLDSKPGHRQVIVLFSDGGNDSPADDLRTVMDELKKRGISVVIVGLGKTTASAIPVKLLSEEDQIASKRGAQWYEYQGEIVTSKLEENDLLMLKNATGGRYVRVVNSSDFVMERMISHMEMRTVPGKTELFPWFLLAALGFFLLSMVIAQEPNQERFRRQFLDDADAGVSKTKSKNSNRAPGASRRRDQ
jgi:Ca-activated chloride channel family protein